MSDKHVPYHLRDVSNPPGHLNPDQQQSWIRAAEKAKKNHQLQQQHPPFHVPTMIYEVQYINRYTTIDTMKLLIEHAEICQEYTIDTEGEKSRHEAALIQIETIPRELPKFVIILELAHLPENDSSRKVLIKKFLRLIFRSGNTVHSWGDLQQELSLVKQKELLDCPMEAFQYDIQALFGDWYTWARSRCGIRDPSDHQKVEDNDILSTKTKNLLVGCACHEPSPYRLKEKWSLQRALIYVSGVFIDKSITINYWSTLLDPVHSKLSRTTHEERIRYLIYDCFATTYFIKPVLDYWTFERLQQINIVELFTSSGQTSSTIKPNTKKINNHINKSNKVNKVNKNIDGQIFKNVLDDDIELISEEEDYEFGATQCISSIINDDGLYEIILNNNDIITPSPGQNVKEIIEPEVFKIKSVHEEEIELREDNNNDKEAIIYDQDQGDKPYSTKPRVTKHQTRSAEARRRRNRQRNVIHRKRRYRYTIIRQIYCRFTKSLVRNILRQYYIRYVHVKVVENDLVIGLKNQSMVNEAEHQLPMNIFNRQGYYHYRRLYQN